MNDGPAAFYETVNGYSFGARDALAMAGLKFQVSSFHPFPFSVFRARGGALGVLTTHIDDILFCGKRDAAHLAPRFLGRRFGNSEVQRERFEHVGANSARATDFLAQ